MKTNFFKMILPAVVIMLGIAGAVSTNAMNVTKDALIPAWGYEHTEEDPCVQRIMCSTDEGEFCTYNGEQLYRLLAPGTCPTVLYKP